MKKFPYTPTMNIAHRGARSLAPENTILAAEKGFQSGADMWELDVAMSADGELVVIHDDTLNRTSNVETIFPLRIPWNVHEFTFVELRTLDFGSWFIEKDPYKQIAQGNVSEEAQQEILGVQIPTLREALEYTKEHQWMVNVELKDLSGTPGDEVVVEKAVKLIEEVDMVDQVIISSFNHSYIVRAKNANDQIVTAALIEDPVEDPIALMQRTNAKALNPDYHLLKDLTVVQTIRKAGYDVYVWTVNDPDLMRQLIEAGVSGIITDFPQVLSEILEEYQ